MTEPVRTPTVRWTDAETLAAVRPRVQELLTSAPGFAKLDPEERRELAEKMVKVCSYMANPDGLSAAALAAGVEPPSVAPLAEAQADGVKSAKERAAADPGFAGEDFQGGAIRQGTEQFGELVRKVDFTQFVSGLIQGVFKAIVDSSIEQMRAYGELLANVAKTVDQFAQDNISENNARDWLAQRYPDKLTVDTSGIAGGTRGGIADGTPGGIAGDEAVGPKLAATSDDPAAALAEVSRDLGLETPLTDLSDETQERRLVLSARLQIARARQQLLASMVMLGINRIVVTDGLIHAKVVFDMAARDTASRTSRASLYDSEATKSRTKAKASYGAWWFSPVKASVSHDTTTEHTTTVESSVDETSESRAELKAKLTGEVRVNFKSDYFPMEKLANPQMIAAIQGNAVPPERLVEGA